LFEDHAYQRADVWASHRYAGRDCSISLLELRADGVVIEAARAAGNAGAAGAAKEKFQVRFDGSIADMESFEDVARNVVERQAPRLGYDYLSSFVVVSGKEIAVAKFSSENGRDYGYDTLYVVWRDRAGEVQSRVVERGPAHEYLQLGEVEATVDGVAISFWVGARLEQRAIALS
jgi:hypothetical protein